MKRLVLHDDAEKELAESAAFYEQRRKGLGKESIAEVRASFKRIRRIPTLFPMFAGTEYRKCIINRFPFIVFFKEEQKQIKVAAVAHQKQKPGYWLVRTHGE